MPDLHQHQAHLKLPTSAISIYKPFFFGDKISPTNKNTLKINKKEKMDLFYVSLLCLFLSFAFLSIFFLFWKNKSTTKNPLPPGKTGWPVFGETLEFMSTRKKGYPEKFVFDRIATYSPHVFKTHLLGQKAAVFCGANGNKFLFSNNNKLVKSWWPKTIDKIFPSSNQYSPNEEAVIFRKWLPNFLKPEALQRYIGIMDDIAQKHFVEFWENKEEINVFPVSKKFTFLLACKVFVSVEDPTHVERLAERFDALAKGFATLPINFPGTTFNKAIRASNFIRNELSSIAKQRKIELAEGKASPTQDILSHMLVTSDDNGRFLNEFDIGTKILGLLVGSHDTGCCVCSAVVKYLAELPEIYQGVYKEQMEIARSKGPGELLNWDDIQKMKYSYNVLCEVMRLTPPLQGAFKEAITDFVYKGYSIPKGWKLYWSISSTHLNPEFFPDPHKFDPSRFEGSGPAPYTYVPFGGGPRMCPGKEYARLEILVFMHHLVKRFKLEKVIPDEKIYNSPLPIPVNGLPIRLYPNKH